MKIIRLCTTVLARFCISLVFLAGAVNKILHWHETERSLMSALCEWQSNIGFSDELHDCLSAMIPIAPLLLVVATLFELLGALAVLVGVKEKLGASLLILFLIPATILMHPFWFVEGALREQMIAHCLKNIAILGGLLMILLQGTEKPKTLTFQ